MKKINYNEARKKLLIQWLIFSSAVIIIFFIQTIAGRYTSHVTEVWKWLFQFLTPPISLMLGVFIAQVTSNSADFETDYFYFKISLAVSYFFLIFLFLSAIIVPYMHIQENNNLNIENQKNIIDTFNTYNNFLLPLQGLSTLALSIFFSKK